MNKKPKEGRNLCFFGNGNVKLCENGHPESENEY
jgi:hypothetical protein